MEKTNTKVICSVSAIVAAAANGHTNVLEWFKLNGSKSRTERAIYGFPDNKYYSYFAIDEALKNKKNNQIPVLDWFKTHSGRKFQYTPFAISTDREKLIKEW